MAHAERTVSHTDCIVFYVDCNIIHFKQAVTQL
jgi:hypothetical protein